MATIQLPPQQLMRDSQVQADDEEHVVQPSISNHGQKQSTPEGAEVLTQQQHSGDDEAQVKPRHSKHGKAKAKAKEAPLQPHEVNDVKDKEGEDSQAAHDSFERAGSGPPSDEAEIHPSTTDADAPAWVQGLITSVQQLHTSLETVSTRLGTLESALGGIGKASTALVKSGRYVGPNKPRPDSDPFLDTIRMEVVRNMALLSSHCDEFKAFQEEATRRHIAIRQATWGLRKNLLRLENTISTAMHREELKIVQDQAQVKPQREEEDVKATSDVEEDNAVEGETQDDGAHHAAMANATGEVETEAGPSTFIPTGPRNSQSERGGKTSRGGKAKGRGKGKRRGGPPRSDTGRTNDQQGGEGGEVVERVGLAYVVPSEGNGEQ